MYSCFLYLLLSLLSETLSLPVFHSLFTSFYFSSVLPCLIYFSSSFALLVFPTSIHLLSNSTLSPFRFLPTLIRLMLLQYFLYGFLHAFSCFRPCSIFLLPSPSVSSFITPSPSSPIPQGQFNHYVVGWVMRSTEQIPPDIRKTVEKPVLRVGWVIFLSWTFLSC